MLAIDILFQSAAVLLALLAIGILIWVNPDPSHSKRLLVSLLLVVTLMNLNGVLYHSRWFLYFPRYHKVLYPFVLLIAPFSYLYIRSVLLQEYRFQRYDWMVLLPAIFMFINLMPYYILPLSEKQAYMIAYYESSAIRAQTANGLLPAYTFPFFRFVWSLLFIVLNFRSIYRFVNNASANEISNNVVTIRWTKVLNSTLTVLLFASFISAITAVIFNTDYHIPDVALGILALIICIALFCYPKILYGVYIPTSTLVHGRPAVLSSNISEVGINQVSAQNYKLVVDHFFSEHRPFLNPNYNLELLVADLKIPRYILSAFINREYNMGFKEFLNRYRINYLLENINKPAWSQFTLEAIAEECGFNSRSTFIKNFKAITGQTPSSYFKSIGKAN